MNTLLIVAIIFFVFYIIEKRRFLNVYLFGLFMSVLFFWGFGKLSPLEMVKADGTIDEHTLGIYFALTFIVFPVIMMLLSIVMFFNSKILLEKEGRRVRNLFFACLALMILVMSFWFIYTYVMPAKVSDARELTFIYFVGIYSYILFLYASSVGYAILYHFTPTKKKPDFIIVLGSGLIGDRVPPLLASRIHKAIEKFKQADSQPTIIMSGGQGSDELLAEGVAMKKYVQTNFRDIDPEKIIVEDQSVNTYQNLLFSKAIMDRLMSSYTAVFVTNNFHVFRASLYAKKVKINAQGIGSKTAFYYLPNAFTREFIGLLVMTKWYHIIFFLLWSLMMGLLFIAYVF